MRSRLSIVVGTFALAACARTQVVQGPCAKVNGADVCTWGEMKGSAVTSFGATVPLAAIKNAPGTVPMVWPPVADATIALPDAVKQATGYQVLTVYWEPGGHPPATFAVPHWDFHFYSVGATDIAAMTCADSAKPAVLPASYVLPDIMIPGIGMLTGLCVAQMGMHSLPGADMSETAPFQKSMVVGYYHQQPVFVEPMLAHATLLAAKSFELDIPSIPGQSASVHTPTHFRADYDSATAAYRFVFSEGSAGAK